MKRLEQLPSSADRALAGLKADEALKQRILSAARSGPARTRRMPAWGYALCCVLALAVCLSAGWNLLAPQPGDQPLIATQAAGQSDVGNERSLLDLNNDGLHISASNAPAYSSLWASGKGGNFPLIGVDGRYYRLLTRPGSVSSSLLGQSLGTVTEFTTEPALSGTGGILSNTAGVGTEVFAVRGMEGTLVAAQVEGTYRVFQRVSFNGQALRGSERLADTLNIAGHIESMELSDVGVVTDRGTCESLFATLTRNASFESSGSVSGKQSLHIRLDNGLTVQLLIKNDNLSACGTWSCPEFLEAFEAAVN